MKKNRATCNFIVLAALVVLCLVFSFVGFILPTTNYYFKGFVNSIPLDYDFDGGVMAIYDVEKASNVENDATAVEKTADRVYELLSKNYNEPIVKRVNDNQIKIIIPATTISSDYLVGKIEFTTAQINASDPDATERIMTSEHIKSASYVSNNGDPGVYIEFNEDGKNIFNEKTEEFAQSESGGTVYIYADGNYSSPVSAVTINEAQTSGYLFLSGGTITTRAKAEAFAAKLESSMVGTNMTINGEELIINSSIENIITLICAIAFACVIIASFVFLVIKYKQIGYVAILSLSIFILVSLILISIPEFFQLSVYGLVASVGLYLFAFWTHLLYLQNSKRECANGKKLIAGFKSGFNKTYNVVIDTNALGFVFSILGYLMGTGAVKSISIIGMFSFPVIALVSIFVLRGLTNWYLHINLNDYKKVNFTKGEELNG